MKTLAHGDLQAEQAKTLDSPRRAYGFLARILFVGVDVVYGRARTLSKFKVLEVIARVPYQAWERVAYIASDAHLQLPGLRAPRLRVRQRIP